MKVKPPDYFLKSICDVWLSLINNYIDLIGCTFECEFSLDSCSLIVFVQAAVAIFELAHTDSHKMAQTELVL